MLESRDNGVSKEEFRQLVLGASQSYIESYYDGNNVGLAPLDANGLSQDLLDVIEVRTRNLINQTAATRRDAETKLENEEEKVVGSVGSEQSVANSSSTAILPENISLPSSPTLSDEGDSDSVDSVSLGQHTTFSKDPNGQLSTSQSGIPPVEETFEETSDGGDHESDYHTDAGELESSGSDPGSLSELRPGLENSIRAIVDAQAVDSDDSEASEAEAEAEEEDVDDDWMEVLDPPQDGPDNAAAIAAAAADDADGGLDDFDGILEAVGLRGKSVYCLPRSCIGTFES